MKRAHSQTSSTTTVESPENMSPGIEDEGFSDGGAVLDRTSTFGPTMDVDEDASHVTVIGAGPAGLMLA